MAPPTINQGRTPRATSLTCKSARKIILGRVAKGPVHRLLLILLTGERYISISVSDSEVIELSCPPQRGVFWLMIVMCWPAARLHAVTECVHVIPPTDFTTLFTLFTLFSLTSWSDGRAVFLLLSLLFLHLTIASTCNCSNWPPLTFNVACLLAMIERLVLNRTFSGSMGQVPYFHFFTFHIITLLTHAYILGISSCSVTSSHYIKISKRSLFTNFHLDRTKFCKISS